MMKKLRVAVVGLRHGLTHAAVLTNHPRAGLAALVDLDPEAVARARRDPLYAGVPGFTDVGQMLQSGVADAAVIAVPTAAHAPVALLCLRGGLHVLLEKPLCRTDAEADSLEEAVRESGKVFQVGYEVRSSPLHQAILRHIRRGDLGEVTNVWWHQHTNQLKGAYGGWRADRINMGGALFDCSPHFLDIIGQWAGAPAVRLVALGNVRGATGPCAPEVLPESAAISIEYANGVRGTFNFGAVNSFADDATFGVAGTTGVIRGNPIDAGNYEIRAESGRMVSRVTFDPARTSSGHLGFTEQWDHFTATVLDGAPNVCPFEDAFHVHRLMRAIDRSLTTGQVQDLPLRAGTAALPTGRTG